MGSNQPSHRVSENGSKIIIHDLELFVGNIEGFDDDKSEIKDLDTEAIDKIIAKTKRFMSAGSNPKLVLMHQDDNGNSPPESIGDILNIHAKPIKIVCGKDEEYEGAGIVGDVEMTQKDFQKYLASNRYPRRSAEIWEDGHLSEVALLGRETPARPLRDTKFTRQGTKKVFHKPATFDMVSAGGSNTYIPSGTDEKEEYLMPEADTILEGEEQVLMRKLRAENATLNDELGKLKAELDEMKSVGEDDKDEFGEDLAPSELDEMMDSEEYCQGHNCEDEEEGKKMEFTEEDEEEDKDMKSEFSKMRKTKGGSKVLKRYAKVKKQRDIYKRRAIALTCNVRRQKFSRVLDQLASQGYLVKQHRDLMLSELMCSKDPVAKVKFWKQTMKRIPLKKTLNTENTRQRTKVNFSEDQKKKASQNAVARISSESLDASSFQKVFQQELRKL